MIADNIEEKFGKLSCTTVKNTPSSAWIYIYIFKEKKDVLNMLHLIANALEYFRLTVKLTVVKPAT